MGTRVLPSYPCIRTKKKYTHLQLREAANDNMRSTIVTKLNQVFLGTTGSVSLYLAAVPVKGSHILTKSYWDKVGREWDNIWPYTYIRCWPPGIELKKRKFVVD